MFELTKKIFIISILLLQTSCSLFHEDLSEAKSYVANQNYAQAITLLDTYKSNFSKKYNAKVHVEYAVSILEDLKIDKSSRYNAAKDLLENSLKLDPKNKKAKTFYLMLIKLINQENAK